MTNEKLIGLKEGMNLSVKAFHLEANRRGSGMQLMLNGIIGINDFSEERIEVMSHGGRLIVTGKKLFINVYENNNLEILGKTEEITFRYGKN